MIDAVDQHCREGRDQRPCLLAVDGSDDHIGGPVPGSAHLRLHGFDVLGLNVRGPALGPARPPGAHWLWWDHPI